MIEENERKYGEEIREKYGDEEVDKSYRKLKNMTKEQYEEAERLSAELKNLLKQALHGRSAGSLHKRLQTCIDNGCAVFGKVTAKKPMPGLPKCMLRTRGLRHIMTRISREPQNF